MQEYSEKRDFPRMSVDCAARYRVDGSPSVHTAIAKDLSGGGLLMWIDGPLDPGSQLEVEIQPGKDITPPLYLTVAVVRCDPRGADAGAGFAIACSIVKMYGAEEPPPQFP